MPNNKDPEIIKETERHKKEMLRIAEERKCHKKSIKERDIKVTNIKIPLIREHGLIIGHIEFVIILSGDTLNNFTDDELHYDLIISVLKNAPEAIAAIRERFNKEVKNAKKE